MTAPAVRPNYAEPFAPAYRPGYYWTTRGKRVGPQETALIHAYCQLRFAAKDALREQQIASARANAAVARRLLVAFGRQVKHRVRS